MKKFLFRLWQWTWGFPQSLLGLVLYCIHRDRPHSQYHGCIVTHWPVRGSLSVGMFLFLGCDDPQVRVHEFGHAVQSLFLGPLFLPLIGLPSFLWCNLPFFRRLRKEKGLSYYRLYTESTANVMGAWATGEFCELR